MQTLAIHLVEPQETVTRLDIQITRKYSKLLVFFIAALKIVDCFAENCFQHFSSK